MTENRADEMAATGAILTARHYLNSARWYLNTDARWNLVRAATNVSAAGGYLINAEEALDAHTRRNPGPEPAWAGRCRIDIDQTHTEARLLSDEIDAARRA